MSLRAVSLLAFSLVIAACTTLPSKPATVPSPAATTDWPTRRAALLALQNFALRGRVAVAAGGEGYSGALRWQQHGRAGQIQLAGPLGIGALDIDFDGSRVQLKDSRGNVLADDAARAEIERRLGFALPLAELGYWVRGVAAPTDVAHEEVNAEGTGLIALEQSGWRVDYGRQTASPLGMLPQKLTARRTDCRLRLAIDQWSGL